MNPTEKTVTIPEAEFKSLVQGVKDMRGEIDGLKKAGGPRIMKAPKEHMVTISYVNGRPVVGYTNHGSPDKPVYVYEAVNPKRPTEYILYVDVILLGDEANPLRLAYTEFMEQAERHECVVTNVRKVEWTSGDSEMVTKKSVADGEYYTTDSGIVVPLEVRGNICFYRVRLHDGSEVEFHERYVNINK